METYQIVHDTLLDLENQYFKLARYHPAISNPCTNGGIQFAAIDTRHRPKPGEKEDQKPLPVVCVVGINYTQEPLPSTGMPPPFSYLSRSAVPRVAEPTGSRSKVAQLIAAYNRNTAYWTASTAKKGAVYPNESGPFGAKSATVKSGLTSAGSPKRKFTDLKDEFILVMTNRCPFITQLKWEDQIRKNRPLCDALLRGWPNHSYMNDLYCRLSHSVDLWIGHSAIWTHGPLYGTAYVWPYFRNFVRHNSIKEWLLSPNINPQAHLWINGCFRVEGNLRYDLFK
jgi:hypothetical protein